MARVDLQCECGYKFFVGDAQLKQKGGAECPACLALVGAPGGTAPAAAKRADPRPVAPEPDDVAPVIGSGSGSKSKLYVIGGIVAAVVVGAIITVVLVVRKPSVDYTKQAELDDQARRKRYEEYTKDAKNAPVPPVTPQNPATSSTKQPEPAKTARPTEFKPMPSEVKTPPPPQKTPEKTPAPSTGGAIPTDLIARLRTELLPLHPFYQGLVVSPAEKSRAETLSSSGRGTQEDQDFLTFILGGPKLKAVRDEIAFIAQTLPTLERESQENLPVDKITLNEGGRVQHCRILDEGVDVVKVSRILASGVGGQLPIRRDSILRIEKGKGIGTDFAARWEAAQKGSVASLVGLLVWCKENNLAGQAKLVAFTILRSDPSNTQARTEAGLPADPVKHSEEVAKGGVISYQGRSWNAVELKEKFLKDGYHLLEGRWYSKKDKMIVVPGLFRYERQGDKPVIFGGTATLCHDIDLVYKQVLDAGTSQYIEQVETRFVRRFYSPPMTVALSASIPPGIVPPRSTGELDIRLNIDEGTPVAGKAMKGEVTIQVPVGVPVLEASVTTTAEVKAGGSIVVYHVTGSGDNEKRTRLYACDPKESQSHLIPADLVRGLTEVNLVAVIEQPATYIPKTERRHIRGGIFRGKVQIAPAVDVIHYRQVPDYKAVLFPSNSNTIEVFRLKLSVAESAPTVDKVFANNPEVLR